MCTTTGSCFCSKLKNWSRLENIEVEKYKPRAATEIAELQRLHVAIEGSFVLLKHLYFSTRSLLNLHILHFLPIIFTVNFQFFDRSIQKSLKSSRWGYGCVEVFVSKFFSDYQYAHYHRHGQSRAQFGRGDQSRCYYSWVFFPDGDR